MNHQAPVYSYPDEVARKWKAERDRYREALEQIEARDGDFPYAKDVKSIARQALSPEAPKVTK